MATPALLALSLIAQSVLHSPSLGLICLASAALSLVLPRSVRSPALTQGVRTAFAMVVPLLAVTLVAAAADRDPAFENYTGWLLLWLASIAGTLLVVANLDHLSPRSLPRAVSSEVLIVTALVAQAAVLRGLELGSFPKPFSGDEAAFALSSQRFLTGALPNMFDSGRFGVPSLYFAFVAAFRWVGGEGPAAYRSASVAVGAGTIAAGYLFAREAFGRQVALLAALFLALYHFHIQFSRQALPNITDPLTFCLAAWLTLRALRLGGRVDYVLAGFAIGFTIYSWTTSRLLPFELVLLVGAAFLLAKQCARPKAWRRGLPFAAAGAFVVAAPLGWFWLNNVDEMNARINHVGIFAGADGASWFDREQSLGRSEWEIYRQLFEDAFRVTFAGPEVSPFYRAEIALVDGFAALFLVLGVIWAVRNYRHPASLFLVASFVAAVLVPGLLTTPPPSSARMIGMVPPVAVFVALGAHVLATGVTRPYPRFTTSLGCIFIFFATLPGLWYYFGDYRRSTLFSDDATRRAELIGKTAQQVIPPGSTLYWLGSDWVNPGHPTLDYYLADFTVISRPALPAPDSSRPRYLLVPGDRAGQMDAFTAACPSAEVVATRSVTSGPSAARLRILTVPGECSAPQPPSTR